MSTDIDTVPADAPRALKRVEGADDTTLDGRHRYAKALATGDDIIPKGLLTRVKQPDGTTAMVPSAGKILVVTEIARMLGFHPLAGIMGVHVIEGKPTISPAMMSAKVRTSGHRLRIGTKGSVEGGDLTAFASLTRSDDPEFEYVVEWSLADAQRAGLGSLSRNGQAFAWTSTKDNWRKYPRAMLKARAIAEVCREAAEDVLMGAAYIPDELGANTDEDGNAVDAPPRKPERDWAAEISAAENIDVLAEIREALRKSPDYTPGLWNLMQGRAGVLMATADEQPIDGDVEDDGTPEGENGTPDAESGTPEDESGGKPDMDDVQQDTTAERDPFDDDPDWTREPCPVCGRNHDASVHDVAEEES